MGFLKNIIEFSYVGVKRVTFFKCHWWDITRLVRAYSVNNYGYTSVNIHGSLNSNDYLYWLLNRSSLLCLASCLKRLSCCS